MRQRGTLLGIKRVKVVRQHLLTTITSLVLTTILLLIITSSKWNNIQHGGAADATNATVHRGLFLAINDDNNNVCQSLPVSLLFTIDYCPNNATDTTYYQEKLQFQSTTNDSKSNQQPTNMTRNKRKTPGILRPSDLPPPEIFTNFVKNTTLLLPNEEEPQTIYYGTVQPSNK
jgi:hypothetical protein